MSSPDTRTPVITEEQLQRLLHAMERSGASVSVSDPRMSQLQTWILGLVGIGLIGAGAWVGQSINTLSTTLSTALTIQAQQGKTIEDHEQRLRDQERKP